jgi:fumarate hydratase, class II
LKDAVRGAFRRANSKLTSKMTFVRLGNSAPGFAEAAAAGIAKLTGLPFVTAPNKARCRQGMR